MKIWDVIIAGGGPSGCAAAIAASRDGAKTLLIESTGCLGGMGTSGLVPAWTPLSDKEKVIYKGIAETITSAAKKGMAHVKQSDTEWVPIDCERLKRVYDNAVTESGCEVLLKSFVCKVEKESSDRISHIVVANKEGLSDFKAKFYIDCTGDGDLAVWAGAEYLKGDDNGDLQPSTLCFILSNVDDYALKHGVNLHPENKESPIFKILANGKYPRIKDSHLCYSIVGPSTVGFNAGHIWDIDNTKPFDVSSAMIEGRKIAMEFRDFLAEYRPDAFANAHLVATAPLLGARETRRIIGDYVLSVDDYNSRRNFHDEIGRNAYFLDIHTAKSEIKEVQSDVDMLHKRFNHYGAGESHGIPYRCLTPKGISNHLVAGRCISADRAVQGSTRVMPVCLVPGEAAGAAVALACKEGTNDLHLVNTDKLRERLRNAGAYFV
jgi:hypothetical protein